MSATPCQATPAHIVREAFLDSRRAKSEGEWWAAGRIEELETELAELKELVSRTRGALDLWKEENAKLRRQKEGAE